MLNYYHIIALVIVSGVLGLGFGAFFMWTGLRLWRDGWEFIQDVIDDLRRFLG